MLCRKIREQIVLLIYDELSDEGRAGIERHVGDCSDCRVALAEERRLYALLSRRTASEPDQSLLESCRRDLMSAIVSTPEASRLHRSDRPGWFERLLASPHRLWMQARVSPASAAALLAVGFLSGFLVVGMPGLPGHPGRQADLPAVPHGESAPEAAATLTSLKALPGTDRVSLTYDTVQRRTIEGSIDEPGVRDMLLAAVQDNLNAGVRLDAIELLRRRAEDPKVREALLRALDDRNPGVRLQAIDALQEWTTRDKDVRRGVLRALLRDGNPGVRVRAVDILSGARDPQTMRAFERLAREDANDYVRLRSAEVLNAAYRQED